ncbi:hypothetical protein HK101_008374 [Irineochytrium annulatum]|nr:hypothetical protein HK101_008374 [Irineochytrium annulatum]
MLTVDRPTFSNWAGTHLCSPSQYVEPESLDDLHRIIHFAKHQGRTIRVVGAGHSPSDIACTDGDGILVSLRHFSSILRLDERAKRVTFQAGIKLGVLNDYLGTVDLAMPNLGSISDQSFAGLISTGTHGTGMDQPILAACIVSLKLLTANLETLMLSSTSHPELFRMSLCSLGCLGIVLEVTIQAVPKFNLEFEQRAIPFVEMISGWDSYVKGREFVRFWWFPHTEECVLWRATKTKKDRKMGEEDGWVKSNLLGLKAYEASLFATSVAPKLLPVVHRRHFERFFRETKRGVGGSVEVFNFDCLFKQYVTEWAIDWNKGPEALVRLKKFIEDSGVVAHAPVEIRFVKGDDIPLSPSYGRDSCYIGIIMYRPYGRTVAHDLFWTGYELIMRHLAGRPHWAKAHPLTVTELEALYPEMGRFREVRRELDPGGLFVNDYVRRHIVGEEEGENETVGFGIRSKL